jgi:hypothetical protein
MKKIKFLLPLLALFILSCDNYLDVNNNNPNNAAPSQVAPNLTLANAQVSSYREVARNMNRLGNFFMNNWGMNVNSFAVTSPAEYSLIMDNSFYSSIWDNTMLNTANFTAIINHPDANYENHKAIAKILKSFYFQYLVDLYGDVPYTQAHMGTANFSPKYDDDKAVYAALYAQINEAIAMINSTTTATKVVGAEDVVYGGNMGQWLRFANTLKLRMLLRQSELTDAATTTMLATEFALIDGASFINTDAVINPGYDNTSNARQNPFYNQMYELNGTTTKSAFNFFRASKYMGDLLNTTSDPRRGSLFSLSSGNVAGVAQGDSSQQSGGTAPLVISSLGTGIVKNSNQNGYMITAAESYFLQAEAVHRGFITGNAQALFDMGIAASMTQLGVAAGAYITNINAIVGKGYGVGTSADKMAAIMYQKNIALQGSVNAMESFIEHTRTGLIDTIPLAIAGVAKPNKPRRLLYPNSEYVGNSANVPAQGDVYTTGAFWFAY